MRRCLIVANQTLTTTILTRAIEERIAAGPHEFHLVAPATPARDEADGPTAYATQGPSTSDRAYALAQQRLDRAVAHLRALGATVDGEVGDPDPLEAVRHTLGHFTADEIVVSTLPLALSQWLRRDLPARLRRSCGVPVVHLVPMTRPAPEVVGPPAGALPVVRSGSATSRPPVPVKGRVT